MGYYSQNLELTVCDPKAGLLCLTGFLSLGRTHTKHVGEDTHDLASTALPTEDKEKGT